MNATAGDSCRIAVINTHPIQYFAPLYAYLNQAEDLSVTALYLSDFSMRGAHDRDFGREVSWDIDLLAGYPSKFVGRNVHTIEPYGFFSTICPELFAEISRARYDAVWIHGYAYASSMVALAAARLKGIPVFMRGETHLGLPSASTRGRSAALRRAVFRQCTGLLAVGSANRDYYRALGIADSRISLVPYTVDNARITAASRIPADERARIRSGFGVHDESPIILYASKFQRRKRPDDLLAAFLRIRAQGFDGHLVMVGTGEMGEALHAAAAAAGDANVHFPGFLNQSELPGAFAASDMFVLPSEAEPWGFIVNEAMCAGLPVVVTAEVGSVPDLVRPGVNGEIFPAQDIDALAAALMRIGSDASLRRRMGEASRAIIDHWSYRECLTGVREAMAKAGVRGRAS